MNRTKNATRNLIFGSILKLYQILIPFLMRTAMIYFWGIQYLGLNSLFTSVLQVLFMERCIKEHKYVWNTIFNFACNRFSFRSLYSLHYN